MDDDKFSQPNRSGIEDNNLVLSRNDDSSSNNYIKYARIVTYDECMNPRDINWITDDIEAKIAPYKSNNKLLGNNEVDCAAVMVAVEAISSP